MNGRNRKAVTYCDPDWPQCSLCRKRLPPEAFHTLAKGGLNHRCKACSRIYSADWHRRNRTLSPEQKQAKKAYDDVHNRTEEARKRRARYRRSAMGKLVDARTKARAKLRFWQGKVAALDKEILEMKRRTKEPIRGAT